MIPFHALLHYMLHESFAFGVSVNCTITDTSFFASYGAPQIISSVPFLFQNELRKPFSRLQIKRQTSLTSFVDQCVLGFIGDIRLLPENIFCCGLLYIWWSFRALFIIFHAICRMSNWEGRFWIVYLPSTSQLFRAVFEIQRQTVGGSCLLWLTCLVGC